MINTGTLTLLVLERLLAIGPSLEAEIVDAIESRAPGRSAEVLTLAAQRGMVRRVTHADGLASLEAAGRPARRGM